MNWPEASSSYTLSATGVQHDKEKTLVSYVEIVCALFVLSVFLSFSGICADFCYEV